MVDDLDAVFGDFYPGSNTRREAVERAEREVEETTWDENPKVLILNGQEVEFFTVGALAEALNRQVVTIRKWERLGYLPKATYREANARKDRLYTRAQIEGLVAIAREEGLMDPSRHVVLKDTRFTERAVRLFQALQEASL